MGKHARVKLQSCEWMAGTTLAQMEQCAHLPLNGPPLCQATKLERLATAGLDPCLLLSNQTSRDALPCHVPDSGRCPPARPRDLAFCPVLRSHNGCQGGAVQPRDSADLGFVGLQPGLSRDVDQSTIQASSQRSSSLSLPPKRQKGH